MPEPVIRVASWPHWYETNPYLRLFYGTLAPYGVRHQEHVPLTASALLRHDPPLDAVHLHWPEPYWRNGAPHAVSQFLRLARLTVIVQTMKRASLKLLWTVHNLEHHEGAGIVDRLGYRFLHRAADLRIFHSRWSRAEARGRYGDRGASVVMPMGNFRSAYPDSRSVGDTRRRYGVPKDRRLLVCFGQIRDYKGFDVAVDSLAHLPPERFHLVIAGRPVGDRMNEISARWADRPAVSVSAREIEDWEAADLLGAADVVLLPYREVTGSAVLLTALGFGCGVVASRLPYFREVLAPNPEAGEFAPAGDPAAFADAVRAYFEVPSARRVRAARRLANRYSWEEVIPPVAEALRRIM